MIVWEFALWTQSYSFPSPSMSALHPCNLPPKKIKINRQTKQTNRYFSVFPASLSHIYLFISHSGLGTCGVSKQLWPQQLSLQMFIAMNCWSGSRPLTCATSTILEPHQNSSGIPCWCPKSWRLHSCGSAGPVPSCAPPGPMWGGCWGVHTSSPGCGPGWQLCLSVLWDQNPQTRVRASSLVNTVRVGAWCCG